MIIKRIFIYLYFLLTYYGISCSDCQLLIKNLNKLIPVTQNYYALVTNENDLLKQFFTKKSSLSIFFDKNQSLNITLCHIGSLLNTSLSFSLTTHRSCKIKAKDYLKTDKNLLELIQDIYSTLSEFFQINPPIENQIEDKYKDDLYYFINKLIPPSNFEFKFSTACQTIYSLSNEFYPSKIDFLFLQHHFFYSLASYFKFFSNIFSESFLFPQKSLCKISTIFPTYSQIPQLLVETSQKFQRVTEYTEHAIKHLIEEQKNKNLKNLFQQLLLRREHPLLTQNQERIAFIPEDLTHTIFIEDKESHTFLYQIEKTLWNPKTMSRISTKTYCPLEIDPQTGLITAPESFKGYSKPQYAFVSFDNLYEEINQHLTTSTEIIKKIQSNLICCCNH